MGASEKRTEGRENKLALTISYHSAAQLVAGGGTEALHMIETEQRASEYMGVRSLTLAILAMQKKKKKKKKDRARNHKSAVISTIRLFTIAHSRSD